MSGAETDLDIDALDAFLSAELDGEIRDTEVVHDGLNVSLKLSTGGDARQSYVLRRPNKLRHTDLFVDLRTEYRVLEGLQTTSIPAPAPVLFCDDESILGGEFLVMTFLDGREIPLGSDLPERFQNPQARQDVADLVVDALADLHTAPVEPFERVCDHHTALEQVERATERLDVATGVTGEAFPTLRAVGEWLRENTPEATNTTLVHGDFRPGNLLFAERSEPEITGVLDWETAMLGDPLTELGYLLLRWRDEGDSTPSLSDIEARHPDDGDGISELRAANEHGLAPFTSKPGSPARRELVHRYEQRTGIDFEHDRFYRAHAAFVLGTVWADLDRFQVEAGGTADRGPLIEYLALVGQGIVDEEFEL